MAPNGTENMVHASAEEMLREQTVLLRQILISMQEERKSRRLWTTLGIASSVAKYLIAAFIAYSLFLFANNLLNETLARVGKSVPTIPSFDVNSIPGLDKIQLDGFK